MKEKFWVYWSPADACGPTRPYLASINMDEVWPERICGGQVEVDLPEPPAPEVFQSRRLPTLRARKEKLLKQLQGIELELGEEGQS